MAERNTGPVKPPVLDLSARDTTPRPEDTPRPETDAAAPKPKNESIKHESSKSESKGAAGTTAPAESFPWGAAATGVVGGALLGTALTYGLLVWGLVPRPLPEANPRIAALEKRLADASESSQSTINTLTQRLGALQNDFSARLEAANEAVAALKAQAPASTEELSGFKAQLDALNARIESLHTGESGASQVLTGDVTALQQRLADLSGKLGTLEDKVGSTDSRVADLAAEAQKAPELPAVQLPLLLTSLQNAFDTGRPFATELASLKTIAPNTVVPTSLSERASQGLRRPDEITSDFAAVLPDMLAATPPRPNADWGEAAFDWLKSMLALRPAGEIAGNSPEALATQLEAAVARRDYSTATRLFAALPPAMQAPAGAVAAEIAVHADADALLDSLRAQALAPAVTKP